MLSDKSITNSQLQEIESMIHQINEEYEYEQQNYSNSRRYSDHKRPPFDPLDINGNEADLLIRDNYSYHNEDASRYRDPYRSKSCSKSRYYGDEGKENYSVRDDRLENDYYNDQYSRRGGYRRREDEYYDRDDPRRRRRRSLEMRDSRYSYRDRSLSPDIQYRNSYRGKFFAKAHQTFKFNF